MKNKQQNTISAWERVEKARDPQRPSTMEYIDLIFEDVIELHGDRAFADDRAVFCGLGRLGKQAVTIIGIRKGRTVEENVASNFGMVHPEGYRKALRFMKQAEKFKRPVITFIDTPGAYPGIGAEARGQGHAIAQNLMSMMQLKIPTLSIILGEAGSGGALALALTNEVWMLENSIYSILSPEGFASILYKDASKASEVVDIMKITSEDLKSLGVIDKIIAESTLEITAQNLKEHLEETITAMMKWKPSKLQKHRYLRFREIGDIIHEN